MPTAIQTQPLPNPLIYDFEGQFEDAFSEGFAGVISQVASQQDNNLLVTPRFEVKFHVRGAGAGVLHRARNGHKCAQFSLELPEPVERNFIRQGHHESPGRSAESSYSSLRACGSALDDDKLCGNGESLFEVYLHSSIARNVHTTGHRCGERP